MSIKYRLISIAEIIDAWRIAPRLFLIVYLYLVFKLYTWFIAIETFTEKKCDVVLLKYLSDNDYTVDQAMQFACTIVDVVGGPTSAQTAFVTTIIGLSAAVFGFYTGTGRKWGNKGDNKNKIQPPVVVNYPTHPPQPNYPSTTSPSNADIDPVKFEP